MRRWSVIVVAIVAAALLVAACDDDGDDNGTNGVDEATATAVAGDGAEATATAPADDGDGDASGAIAELDGNWSGVWNNDTFGSTADMTLDIAVNDDGTASFTLDLLASDTGSPFGVPAPGAKTLDGTHDGDTLTVELTGDDLFGDMTVIIADGTLAATATMEPVTGIIALTVEGTVTADTMDLTYIVTFEDGSDATGTATLTKS